MASWSSAAGSGKDQPPSRESWCGFTTSLVLGSAIASRNNDDSVLNDCIISGGSAWMLADSRMRVKALQFLLIGKVGHSIPSCSDVLQA